MTQKIPLSITPTEYQIRNACMYYRHNFGLLTEQEQRHEMFLMREYWRAIYKALEDEIIKEKIVPISFSLFSPSAKDVDKQKRYWVGYKNTISEYWIWRFTNRVSPLDTHWLPYYIKILPTI